MRIGIIGTGAVARALGRAFTAAGHDVAVGTRDPEQTKTRPEWLDSDLTLTSYGALQGDAFINATSGAGAAAALDAVGNALDGAVVVDVSNPLDFARGFPPTLAVCNTDSLAERLQRAHPRARLVKMFNTMANEVMVNPDALPGESTVFVAGNDADARATASTLARDLGWSDILDLGDLTGARGLEVFLPLWLRLYGAVGHGRLNIKVVR